MNVVTNYWTNMVPNEGLFHCPNLNLFRLIGQTVGPLSGKNVLEIGFGYGADLMECERRGAKVYGLDLNNKFVTSLSELGKRVAVFHAGVDKIEFNAKFDLIYCQDLIYYLTNKEIITFLADCKRNLAENGKIIFQFVEKGLEVPVASSLADFTSDMFAAAEEHALFPKENPVRFLKFTELQPLIEAANLSVTGSKRVLHSYNADETLYRLDKYVVLS